MSGRVPHPTGFVDVVLKRTGDALEATVTLPDGVSGDLFWKGKRYPLQAGSQKVSIR
ncbi:hypothetical protein [Luteitalea pratensis]|uniref:hypothetical protein n=1 Tax=Luteitalea pratensis TaxID=1855912 RepID=UPI0012FF7C79|nr:hypothetical protein [Luteitalea pratensis]